MTRLSKAGKNSLAWTIFVNKCRKKERFFFSLAQLSPLIRFFASVLLNALGMIRKERTLTEMFGKISMRGE